MLSIFLLLLGGVIAGSGATALIAAQILQRQQRLQLEPLQQHIAHQVSQAVNKAVAPICVTASKLTEVVAQMQDNQGKQHEQLHKLAEFSLQMKKELAILAARQLTDGEDETDLPAAKLERRGY